MSSLSPFLFEDIAEMRKFDRNEPYTAAMWMLRHQIGERADGISLRVYIRKMKHQKGQVWTFEGEPNVFSIVISSDMGRQKSLRTIAHETRHITQYVTGQMKDVWGQHKRKVLWKDKIFDTAESGIKYYNSPWEKDAYAHQDRIMNAYVRHLKKMSV